MHDMSNTRKEIAARLGFAASNGAKVAMGMEAKYSQAFRDAMQMMEKFEDLEPTSAFKQAASDLGISEGEEMRKFVEWARKRIRASRPGAKAKFEISSYEQAEYQIALSEERIASYRKALANTEAMIRNANSLMRTADSGDKKAMKEVIGIARMLESTMKSRGFSRPGAKTRMTREQTEEQKAGLKIMSAADPAVGAKIAKLIKEGKPQDQAVAIALDMKRRGEL